MLDRDELIKELKEKFIEALGSESTAASVFEDPEFIDKLEQILYWLVGKVILETPVRTKTVPAKRKPESTRWVKSWTATVTDYTGNIGVNYDQVKTKNIQIWK